MNPYSRFNLRPIQVGFYKVTALNYPYAKVEFKESLRPEAKKLSYNIDLNILYDARSQKPSSSNASLYLKIIHVIAVFPSNSTPQYANWGLVTREQLVKLQRSADGSQLDPSNILLDAIEEQYNDDVEEFDEGFPEDDQYTT